MQTLQSAFLAIIVLAGGWWALEQTDQTALDPDSEEFFVEDDTTPLVSGVNSEQWFSEFPKPNAVPALPSPAPVESPELSSHFPSIKDLVPEEPFTIKTLEPLPSEPAVQQPLPASTKTPNLPTSETEVLSPVAQTPSQAAELLAKTQTATPATPGQSSSRTNKTSTPANLASMTSSGVGSPEQRSPPVLATSAQSNHALDATLASGPEKLASGPEKTVTKWSELTTSGQPIGWSLQNQPITGYRIGEGTHRVLIIAGLSGTDRVTPRWLQEMLNELQKTQPAWLSKQTLVAVPRANPDGHQLGQPGNARQVELLQNFPTASFRYGLATSGSGPASEPEVRALMRLMGEFSPERVIVVSNSHSLTEVRYGALAAGSVSRWSEQFGIRTEPLFVAGRQQACVEYAEKVLGVPGLELCVNPENDWQQALLANQDLFRALLTIDQASFSSFSRPSSSTPVRPEETSPTGVSRPSRQGYEELAPPPG